LACAASLFEFPNFSRRFTPLKKNREKYVDVRNNWSGIRQQH
jgi:hypothetical protein